MEAASLVAEARTELSDSLGGFMKPDVIDCTTELSDAVMEETSELTELRRDDPREVASAGVREVDVDVTTKVD